MIGLFDSGIGGSAILNEIRFLLPKANLFYLKDTAYFPYGTKSFDTVIERALWCSEFLVEKGAKVIVAACNTASACALDALKSHHSIPIIGMIQPLVEALQGERIGLLATPTTIQTGVYQAELRRRLPHATLFSHPAPELVEMVESHEKDLPLIQRTLAPLKEASLDTLILGCTHFSLIKDTIAKEMGPDVAIKESGPFCAKQVSTLVLFPGIPFHLGEQIFDRGEGWRSKSTCLVDEAKNQSSWPKDADASEREFRETALAEGKEGKGTTLTYRTNSLIAI